MRISLSRRARPALLGLNVLLFVFATGAVGRAGEVDPVVVTARAWLASLAPAQRARAEIAFEDRERMRWHFFPGRRRGVTLREMNAAQREAAHAMIRAALSAAGYRKVRGVFALEARLQEALPRSRRRADPSWRDPLLYAVTVFGVPSVSAPWGWRLEGHHLSINITCVDGRPRTGTPLFFGATPTEVPRGARAGLRVLKDEEDLARALVQSLTPEQRAEAVRGSVPASLLLGPRRKASDLPKQGIAAANLNAAQRGLLRRLIEAYVGNLRADVAEPVLAQLTSDAFAATHFVWMGAVAPRQHRGYRIHGPTLRIELLDGGDHIHSVWRDAHDDFGVASVRASSAAAGR